MQRLTKWLAWLAIASCASLSQADQLLDTEVLVEVELSGPYRGQFQTDAQREKFQNRLAADFANKLKSYQLVATKPRAQKGSSLPVLKIAVGCVDGLDDCPCMLGLGLQVIFADKTVHPPEPRPVAFEKDRLDSSLADDCRNKFDRHLEGDTGLAADLTSRLDRLTAHLQRFNALVDVLSAIRLERQLIPRTSGQQPYWLLPRRHRLLDHRPSFRVEGEFVIDEIPQLARCGARYVGMWTLPYPAVGRDQQRPALKLLTPAELRLQEKASQEKCRQAMRYLKSLQPVPAFLMLRDFEELPNWTAPAAFGQRGR